MDSSGARHVGFYDAELARPEAPSRAALWTGWVLGALPALFLLIGSVTAMMHSPQVVEGTTKMGFQPSILPVLGTLEFCCAVLYLIPRTAVLGAVLLTAYFGGAVGLPCAVGADAVVSAGAVWGGGVGGVIAAAARAAADDGGGVSGLGLGLLLLRVEGNLVSLAEPSLRPSQSGCGG